MLFFFRNCLLICCFFAFSMNLVAQKEYLIEVNIKGYSDSTVLLTSYFGKKIKLVDTAMIQKKGKFLFEGEKKLPGGIYMVISENKEKLFEFIVSDDQSFILSTDTIDYAGNMKVSGSKENKIFYNYLKFNEEQYKKSKAISAIIDSLEENEQDISEYKEQLINMNSETISRKIEIINDNQGLFVASLLNAMRDIDIPDSVTNSSDSSMSYKYYKAHYWDYIDLSDSCLLRSPVYMRKVEQYFDQVVVFHPDSVISAIDLVISKARPNNEVVGYLVWYYISEYQNPKFMGFDKVMVHLVDEYFSKEDIAGTTESIRTSLQERADKLRPNLIGGDAPDMMLVDTLGHLRSFNELTNDYVVIFFWDFDCGICGKEIKVLKELHEHDSLDIAIYSVNVNGDIDKWKKSIITKGVPGLNVNGTRSATKDFHDLYDIYGTPVVYLLDKDKKIVAKRIGASKITEFIENYEKNHNTRE